MTTKIEPVFSQQKYPTTLEYYARNLTVPMIGQAIIHHCGHDETISFKAIDRTLGLNFLPGANAQEVVAEKVSEAAAETIGATRAIETSKFLPNCLDKISSLRTCAVDYLSENSHWIAPAGSIVFTSAVVNHLSSKTIKNAFVRNTLSLGVGVAVTWLGAYGFGYELSMNKAADLGLQIATFHVATKYVVAPTSRLAFSVGRALANVASMDMAFPVKHEKMKSN